MRAFLLTLSMSALAFPALAQPPADVAGARSRAPSEIDCLQRQASALRDTLQLLQEARAQLDASQTDLREAAAHSVVSLEQRVVRIARDLKACVPNEAALETRTRVQENTGTAARVAQENPATQVIEENTRLGDYVRVVRGERVDGHGNVASSEVRRMFSRIGDRIQRCYGSYVDRNALEAGGAILSFTVTTSGRVRSVRVEQAMGDATFQRCLRHAGRAIRASTAATGGDVQFAYTLRFGPG